MHNMHEGSLLKRLRIRLFGLSAREQAENLDEFERRRRRIAVAMERARNCTLCLGDGWITDTAEDCSQCAEGEERGRFFERVGKLTGAAEGRMACPRCQPNWRAEVAL